MPDLSPQAVHQFWSGFQESLVYRVVTFLEAVEHWILDGQPEFEEKMQELGQELDNLQNVNMNELGHEKLYIEICNATSSARTLRLLQAIDAAHPGSASRLLMHAEETSQHPDDMEGFFLKRNIEFERLRLLGRVFTKERLELVLTALEGDIDE
jgi:intracellular multiplication protein IcmW